MDTIRTGAGFVRRDSDELRRMLRLIDDEGWDGPTATSLLARIREDIARPMAIRSGLRGAAASQAKASAWAAVWEELATRDVRAADEPWGVVWKVAEHAVANEVIAARFGTNPRQAWQVASTSGVGHARQLVGLAVLDWHPRGAVEQDVASAIDIRTAYVTAIAALRDVGWPPAIAARIVGTVAGLPYPGEEDERGPNSCGWRKMADQLGLPPWQARRLYLALLGTASWPGLLARMVYAGPAARYAPSMRAALRSTRQRRLRSPLLAAARAEDEFASGYPQLAAS